MPPSKTSKTAKASKAAKAILHPKSTIASVRANHSRQASTESASTSEGAAPAKSPASSIRRAPSNASIASNAGKPLPSAPSSTGSPAASIAALPTAAPAPSVLAPAIGTDILSLKKSAMDRMGPAATAAGSPTSAQAPFGSVSAAAKAAPASSSAAAVPYAIDDGVSTTSTASVAKPVESAAQTATAEAAKDTEAFAAKVAAVLAESEPAPGEKPLADAVAAPGLVAHAIVNKPAEAQPASTPASPPAPQNETTPSIAPAAAALAQVATFTPPELTRLQHNTFVSRPTDASRAALRDLEASALPAPLRPLGGLVRAPSHIVIFGWMDAPIRLVAKYAQPYTVLFPDATVLIQLSDGKSYLARDAVRRQQLQRVIAELSRADETAVTTSNTKDVGDSTITLIEHSEARSASSSEDGKPDAPEVGGFVIHSFSDGGAGNLALFLDELVRRKAESPRVHSLIMDSSPGKSNPTSGSVAFTMHLANRPRVRAIVRFFVYLGLYLLQIWTKVTGRPGRGELMRKRLNSLRSWSWVTASYSPQQPRSEKTDFPPRMYMYTRADKLIPWQYVEEHAHHLARLRHTQPHLVQMEKPDERQAVTKHDGSADYTVELRRWDSPPHCSIGRADFEGYWAAVMDFHLNVLSRR
ncbi:conserved hypothetical protein [Sporisorium reilianum SRZ2]|uniref:Uncharacterized protein n=1 Tax=Sporisorium reilianum (strain SRZ2) TaxID=999809 RepID=E6ZPF4_SPORE|nr:conserved hypothetical protein [Sporisorium reilianum SRZ2]